VVSREKNPMKIVKAIAWVGLLAMAGVIGYAFLRGDFAAEGSQLLGMPWGIVSLVDLYVGFALFSCWIVYRERSVARSVVWVFLMMILGNFTAALYVLLALYATQGDWRRFWLGNLSEPASEGNTLHQPG
jgi:hypothetical protein